MEFPPGSEPLFPVDNVIQIKVLVRLRQIDKPFDKTDQAQDSAKIEDDLQKKQFANQNDILTQVKSFDAHKHQLFCK